jgi:hypothetical protein
VRDLVQQGASVIKIAIEPGGEPGAPWSQAPANPPPPWPVLSVDEVRAIVDEAHGLGRTVTVHLGEAQGARIALEAGVDEWAHIPGDAVPEDLLRQAVRQRVRVVATLDTESHCAGDMANARTFVALSGMLLLVAARTTSIKVVPNVLVVPNRHPAVLAKMAETLDRLSGGRLVIAVAPARR